MFCRDEDDPWWDRECEEESWWRRKIKKTPEGNARQLEYNRFLTYMLSPDELTAHRLRIAFIEENLYWYHMAEPLPPPYFKELHKKFNIESYFKGMAWIPGMGYEFHVNKMSCVINFDSKMQCFVLRFAVGRRYLYFLYSKNHEILSVLDKLSKGTIQTWAKPQFLKMIVYKGTCYYPSGRIASLLIRAAEENLLPEIMAVINI